jgi:hypothetical protein
MTKRLVEINDDLLDRARAIAGVGTITGTVTVALQRLVDQDTAVRHVHRLRTPGTIDVRVIEESRRSTTQPDE